MKVSIAGLVVALMISSSLMLSGQTLSSAWFGGVGVGIAAHDNGPFSDRLQSWSPRGENNREIVYRTGRFSSTGLTLNAGGGVLFSEHFIVGAAGEFLSFPTVEAVTSGEKRSRYDLSGGGGELELGFALFNSDATLVWPYLALGYYGYSLDFTNNQTDSIPFFEGEPIPPGQTANYHGASFRPGIGVGLTRIIGGSKGGSSASGLVLSARLGWGIFLSHPEWEGEEGIVKNGGHTPCYDGVALSITIGGGRGSF